MTFDSVPISEAFEIISGGTPKRSIEDYWNGEIPWISIKDFNDEFRFLLETEDSITTEGLKNSSTNILEKNDIIISARGTVGKINMIRSPMAFNQSCYGLRAKKDLDATYGYFVVKNSIRELQSQAYGSVFSTITKKTFNNIKIPIYPLSKQKEIANILSSFDDKIENNNAIIANLEEQAQTIFKSWFVDFEPFQNKEFIDSELGLIPESFSVATFDDFASVSSGKRMKNSEKTEDNIYPIIGASKITGYTDDYLFDEKVIITGRVGTLGTLQIYNSKIWPSDNTLILTSDLYAFTYFALKAISFSALNRGSTQPLVSQKDIKDYKVILPNIEWLSKFEKVMKPIFNYYWKIEEENQKLAEIRDTLLPKLMSGEIRVGEASEVK